MAKVSVVVPVYGVEKYIERCARSLFEQTLDDMEFIFVDDCSIDRSIEVLNGVLVQYPNRKNQVKIIKHEVNKGLPQARKTGIFNATGDYIAHCDSDDWVDTSMYKTLYEETVRNNYDMIFYDYFLATETESERHLKPFKTYIIEDVVERMLSTLVNWSMCFHLVRSDLYKDNDIIYPTANIAEDRTVTIQLLGYAKKIGKINEPYYYYFVNNNSMTLTNNKSKIDANLIQLHENTQILINYLGNSSFANKDLLIKLCKLYEMNCYNPFVSDDFYYKLRNCLYPEIGATTLFDTRIALIVRLRYLWGLTRLYPIIKKIRR